jgi:tetratricopeptide (TPR) repeat protein
MNLSEIEKLAKEDRYDEALAECDALLRSGVADSSDILRTRAYVYARSGQHSSASADYEEVLKRGDASIRDYYQAGDQALKAEDMELAFRHFREVLTLGERQSEAWFKSAVLFYLAFIEMNRKNCESALTYVDQARSAEPDCAMPLPGQGMVSVQELEARIRQRCR